MKTFKDLVFEPHSISELKNSGYVNAKHAVIRFDNDYGVSVVFGKPFYSNGKDTYELAVLFNGKITYDTYITDDVMGHLSEEEVTEVMLKVANLK